MQTRLTGLSLVAVMATFGCSSSPTRTITGQLTAGAYTVDNPVVIAQTTSMDRYVSHVQPDGSFHIGVPVGVRFQLLLANSTRSGQFVNISHINFSTATGQQHFVTLAAGSVVALGAVSPVGATLTSTVGAGLTTMSETEGASGGDRAGSDDKGEGDDKAEDDDDGKPDHADVCDGPDVTESKCDHAVDDDGDHHARSHSARDGGSLTTSDDHEGDDDKTETEKDEPKTCPPSDMNPSSMAPAGGGNGGCTVNADCAPSKRCLANICSTNNIL
jgi:hypothetical protein